MSDDLVATTRRMLKASTTPKPEIAAGAGVSLRWLYQFEKEDRENFTLRTVRGLNAYLTGTPRKSSAPHSRALVPSS